MHDVTLQTALKIGHMLGISLPSEVIVVGVECSHNFEFTEALSAPVAAAVPLAAQMVFDLLERD